MKRFLVLVALSACGNRKDAPPTPAPAPDIGGLPVPRVVDSNAVLPLGKLPRPTHVVWMNAIGALTMAPADKVWTGGLPTAKQPVANLDALAATVVPAVPAERDPWAAQRSDAVETLRGYLRAPAATGMRDADEPHVLVLAPPDTPAARVIELVERVGGRFSVALPKAQLGALRIVFRAREDEPENERRSRWVELHLATSGVDAVSFPENGLAHIAWGKAMPDELRAIVKATGKQLPNLDVFAGDGVTYQALVDTLVALDDAGVTTLSLGASPGPAAGRPDQIAAIDAARAAAFMTPRAVITVGQPNAQGDLEKALIRSVVRGHARELLACYDTQVAKQPELRGTVSSQFFITPNGDVASSSASGVAPTVSTCIADLIKTFAFPKPKGGGGVQVNYPFTFRPRES